MGTVVRGSLTVIQTEKKTCHFENSRDRWKFWFV